MSIDITTMLTGSSAAAMDILASSNRQTTLDIEMKDSYQSVADDVAAQPQDKVETETTQQDTQVEDQDSGEKETTADSEHKESDPSEKDNVNNDAETQGDEQTSTEVVATTVTAVVQQDQRLLNPLLQNNGLPDAQQNSLQVQSLASLYGQKVAQPVSLGQANQGMNLKHLEQLGQTPQLQQATKLKTEAPTWQATALPTAATTTTSNTGLDNLSLLSAVQGKNGLGMNDAALANIITPPATADMVNVDLAAMPKVAPMQWGPISLPASGGAVEFAKVMMAPVSDQLRFQVNQNIQQAEIRLDPADLGKIDLNIRLDGDRLHIQMNAANNNVRDALQSGLERLKAELELEYQGDIQLDVGQKQEQQAKQQQDAESDVLDSHGLIDEVEQLAVDQPKSTSSDVNLLA